MWRARASVACPSQRGVLMAPTQDHGKNGPHRERGQSGEKPRPGAGAGGPKARALQEAKAQDPSALRSRAGWHTQ